MSKKILCIGEALIDMICTDKGSMLSQGENFVKKAGGAPANVAAAIAALGGKVDLAAKVGIDPFGQHLVDVMNGFSVGTAHFLRDANSFTTFAFVSLMENGERDFYFNRGADGRLSVSDIENIDLSAYDLVHFGSATAFLPGPLQDAYKHLLKECLSAGIYTTFDPNYRHLLFKDDTQSFIDQSWHFIRRCNFFKVSDEEAILLTGETSVEAAAKKLIDETTAAFAITIGKDGTMFGNKGTLVTVPSIKVSPVDTTGAGDAFVGAVVFQLQQQSAERVAGLTNGEWYDIILKANKAGARTCEYFGAMEAFKHLTGDILI